MAEYRDFDETMMELEESGSIEDLIDSLLEQRLCDPQNGNVRDAYACGICQGVLVDPVTLSCGHTFTRSCLMLYSDGQEDCTCPTCYRKFKTDRLLQLKVNVVVSNIVDKWWPSIAESTRIAQIGNHLLQSGDLEAAIAKYDSALKIDPTNHLAALNRSSALLAIGHTTAALTDAETVISLYPMWSKGYYHKGSMLVTLWRYESAVISFIQSYMLDPKSTDAKSEAKHLLHQIYSMSEYSNYCDSLNGNSLPTNNLLQQKSLAGSEGSLFSTDSFDSLNIVNGNLSDEDDFMVWPISKKEQSLPKEKQTCQIIQKAKQELQEKMKYTKSLHKSIDPHAIDTLDFECPVCIRLLLEPVTTPCGHTFCRSCLNRCLDYQSVCPLCKHKLTNFLAERNHNVTEFIDYAIKTLLPNDYADRKCIHDREIEELANAGKDLNHVIPLFVCTIAYPSLPCPLHVFEPRYRLMIRQCIESGSKQFGMCAFVEDCDENISTVGTMLKIEGVEYLPDGRSIVQTVGQRRFTIIKKGMRDGYHTGAVEFLHDQPLTEEEKKEIKAMHDLTWEMANSWIQTLPLETRETILSHFGPMPPLEDNYLTSPDGPSWLWWVLAILPLELKVQLLILKTTSLYRRLDALRRILLHISQRENFQKCL